MADNVIVRVPEQQFIRGEDGYSPVVTIEDIEHGHRVTITDREHPVEGQSFDVMDGASAYEQAADGGYSGTEAEFNEELANFKEYAQQANYARSDAITAANTAGSYSSQARQAVNQAQSAMNAAQRAATQANSSATAAADSAATALTRMNSANSSAQAAADSATAAGDAKAAAETAQGKAEDAQEAAEQAQSNAETAAQSVSQSAAQISQNASDISDLKSAVKKKAPAIYDTASGAIASFEDGADGMPLKSLMVNIEPAQSGTGDPSPENVRPITGWTGCKLFCGGKNLIPSGITVGKGYINASGDIAGSEVVDVYRHIVDYIRVYPNTAYTISGDVFGKTAGQFYNTIAYYDANKNFLSRFVPASFNTPAQFTTPSNCAYIRFNFPPAGNIVDIQMEYGNAATSFDSQASVYSITFPTEAGTVYGGTLDVVNKRLAVEWVSTTLQMFASNWDYVSSVKQFFATSAAMKPSQTRSMVVYCDRYRCLSNREAFDKSLDDVIYAGEADGQGRIYVQDLNYNTVESFLTAMGDAQIVYPLASPIVYDLTDIPEITTLHGANNLWADCGPVSVNYPADTKLYIQKINAPTDDDMIADTQIDSGKYFLIGNTLYLSTTVIPAGDTIIPGTNCQKTNLAAALNALNA